MDKAILKLRQNNVILELNGVEKMIGELHDSTFVTRRDSKKHLMRKWNAYGINAQIIDSSRVKTVVIQEDSNKRYIIDKDELKSKSRFYKEDGNEPQYFISREDLQSL